MHNMYKNPSWVTEFLVLVHNLGSSFLILLQCRFSALVSLNHNTVPLFLTCR